MCSGRKVTKSRTGEGKYRCACVHLTGKCSRVAQTVLNGEIKLPVAHVHFEKNLHSVTVRGCLKSYIPCTVTKSIVCNRCGRPLRTMKFATRYALASLSTHLDSTDSCCKLHTLVWNRPHAALVTQYTIP